VTPESIAVIGLGYVGLPVAAALATAGQRVVGFDVSKQRIAALRTGVDASGELTPEALGQARLTVSEDSAALRGTTFFIVTVPTPVDREHRPDLGPIAAACRTIGQHLSRGAIVVFESTVFPGCSEEFCAPILEEASGLSCGSDFTVGYSPERINPGDRLHTLDKIVKVVAGQDPPTLERIVAVYSTIVPAGLHHAPSIKVAEAAKVIENIQRDLNIALINELAMIFDRIGIPTRDVLAAAATKWNFLNFTPGLVGGHCIGVDPYYLTAKAESVGYHPEVILSGRRINDGMGRFVAQKTIKLMAQAGMNLAAARIGVLGLTFKENVPDIRNSKVVDIITELRAFGHEPLVHDPLAEPEAVHDEYRLVLSALEQFQALDALIIAVGHKAYRDTSRLLAMVRSGGVIVDVKGLLDRSDVPKGIRYWSL
jgi:UDP-N-acetyl-D-galactosamine dehydrogenase